MANTTNTTNTQEQQEKAIPGRIIVMALILVVGAIPPMLDTTIVNIAVNDLSRQFAVPFVVTQWVVTGYTLALGIAVPFSGWLVQKFDGKRIFMSALGLFLVGSLLSGLSWNIESLIAFRVVQGFASGLLIPTLTTLLVQVAGSDKIGRLMSIVSVPIVLAPILGPVIGGLILQRLPWHWLFFVNLPVGAVALLLMQWKLPKFAPTNTAAKLDWLGITLLALISGMFIYGVTEIMGTDAQTLGLGALIAGAVATLLYLLYAWRQAGHALIPLGLFRSPNFSAAFVSLFLAGFATNGPMLLLPVFFQNVRGLDAITAALWLIPQGVGMLLTRSPIGRMTDRFGARLVVLPAIAIIIVGTLPFAFFDATTPTWLIWLVLLVRGIGIGGFTIPVMTDAYVGMPKPQIPQVSIATRIIQNVGAAFGSALLATVVTIAFAGPSAGLAGLTSAYHAGFLVSLAFTAIGILPAAFLTNRLAASKADAKPDATEAMPDEENAAYSVEKG
jgi:EmrB/QacA subfamily drug resistance transporter